MALEWVHVPFQFAYLEEKKVNLTNNGSCMDREHIPFAQTP